MTSLLDTVWRTGRVRRWHAHPDLSDLADFDDAHQGRCVLLLLTLWPGASRELIAATATHDTGESVVGDIPYPHKDRPYAAEIARMEDEARALLGFGWELGPLDQHRLRLVDRLDAYMFVRHWRPECLASKEWVSEADTIYFLARQLDVLEAVVPIIRRPA